MVTPAYLLDKPARPTQLKTAFDQQVIPALIDTAAMFEGWVPRLTERVRQAPLGFLAVALLGGVVLGLAPRRR